MLLFLYSAAILAAGNLADAHPTNKRDAATDGTLAPALWINGEVVSHGGPTAAAAPCTAADDVLSCASKISESWKIAPSAPPASRVIQVPCLINDPQNGHVGGCYFDANITVDYSTCSLSDPVIVHKDTLQFCNDACKNLPAPPLPPP